MAVAPAVDGLFLNEPPSNPGDGACYVVGQSPQGAWAGQSNCLAGYGEGGWRFVAPFEGMTVFDRAGARFATFVDVAWEVGILRGDALLVDDLQVVGPRLPAIGDPAGGTSVDVEARAAITAILGRLRQHGLIAG